MIWASATFGVGVRQAVLAFNPATVAYSHISFARERFDGHIARVGLNYHFTLAPPAPVVARY